MIKTDGNPYKKEEEKEEKRTEVDGRHFSLLALTKAVIYYNFLFFFFVTLETKISNFNITSSTRIYM